MRDLDATTVGECLGLPEHTIDRLGMLPARPGIEAPELPADVETAERLSAIGVPDKLIPDIRETRPDPVNHPEAWWILDRTYRDVVGGIGAWDGFGGWPALPPTTDEVTRHVYLWTFVAALPHTRRFLSERGIPDDLSRPMLEGIGDVLEGSRKAFGVSGMLLGMWVPPLIMRGVTYELGRLTYDFGSSINLHIPNRARKGRLDPAACDASIEWAKEFSAKHFPEHHTPEIVCHSWLLDPQVSEYLPADSNLIRFQRRFRLTDDKPERADRELLHYLFDRHLPSEENLDEDVLAALPQDSTLRRAFVSHLRSGRHWHSVTGTLSDGRGREET